MVMNSACWCAAFQRDIENVRIIDAPSGERRTVKATMVERCWIMGRQSH
jgi:hypothetical protein